MTLGLSESRERKKRKRRLSILKWLLGLSLILAAGLFSYESGSRLAERETIRLKEQIAELSTTIATFEAENRDLKSAVAVAENRMDDWRQRYQRDVPTGEVKEIYDLARQKLSDGVAPARLSFVIGAARNVKDCGEGLATKRFIVPTSLYKGANDTVSFGNNQITVTAEGRSARDGAGNLEARYDPAQPLTVRFTLTGGKSTEITGLLPLHHSIVVGDSEFRFTMIGGAPGFVKVTGGRCSYP